MKAIMASHETPCQWQRPSSRAGPGRRRCSAAAAGCTDCSVPLAVPEFLESEQRRPLALAARRRSLRPGLLRSAETRARRAGPTVEGRFQSLRFEFLQILRSFRGYYQGSESKEPQSIK